MQYFADAEGDKHLPDVELVAVTTLLSFGGSVGAVEELRRAHSCSDGFGRARAQAQALYGAPQIRYSPLMGVKLAALLHSESSSRVCMDGQISSLAKDRSRDSRGENSSHASGPEGTSPATSCATLICSVPYPRSRELGSAVTSHLSNFTDFGCTVQLPSCKWLEKTRNRSRA